MQVITLVRARTLTSNVRELTFATSCDFLFEPGQWVNLFFPKFRNPQGAPLKRAYSIASAPRPDGTFDLAVTRVTDGPASTKLHCAELRESFNMSGPHGVFVLSPLIRPVLLVATGTGVAPFRSMLQAVAMCSPQPITLLLGSRDERDILYREEFESLAQSTPRFVFCPTLSQANPAWSKRRGYVQAHLPKVLLDTGSTNCDVYVCGLAEMVHDVRRVLLDELGVNKKDIHIERYD